MSTKALTTYLNDHLGGSVAALELLDHLIERHPDRQWAGTLAELKREIESSAGTLSEDLRVV